MKNGSATFPVYKGSVHVGFVKAGSHPVAVARAHARYGICDVDLPVQRGDKSFGDYLSAAQQQQHKQSRRYPVGDFEARRAALIAEVLG